MTDHGNLMVKPRAARSVSEPHRAPYIVVDDFLPLDAALAMRKDIEAHFGTPERHKPDTHQVWNYWFVPKMYTYLRATPEKVIERPRVQNFYDALLSWSSNTLGMAYVTWPYLSLYVSGCRQGLHNDALNGRFGFVYSLTPNERKTSGGETIIFHEGDPVRNHLRAPASGQSFYEAVAPRFNRLVVFDDRMPHAVEQVDGSMDPVEGRIVLHGHLGDGGPIIIGSLSPQAVLEPVSKAVQAFAGELNAARAGVYHGPLVVRLLIDASGHVHTCDLLLDRVKEINSGNSVPETHIASLMAKLSALAFLPSTGETSMTLPIMFGGDLRAAEKK
jgi:hypothetical protein